MRCMDRDGLKEAEEDMDMRPEGRCVRATARPVLLPLLLLPLAGNGSKPSQTRPVDLPVMLEKDAKKRSKEKEYKCSE